MANARPRYRASPALAIFLLAAVAFGAAAALLATPATPTPSTISHGDFLSWATIRLVLPFLVFGFIGLWIVLHWSGGRQAIPSRALVTMGVTFLLCIAFLIVARTFIADVSSGPSHGGNLTGNPPPPPPGTGNPNGPGNISPLPSTLQSLGVWVPYIAALGAVGVAALLVLPYLVRRRAAGTDPTTVTTGKIRQSLDRAIEDLDAHPEADVRSRIIAAYARLLRRIDPTGLDFEPLTAKEIEVECTVRMGVSPRTAHELTALFEEARYSTHALVDRDLDRARLALQQALADLDRPRLFA